MSSPFDEAFASLLPVGPLPVDDQTPVVDLPTIAVGPSVGERIAAVRSASTGSDFLECLSFFQWEGTVSLMAIRITDSSKC